VGTYVRRPRALLSLPAALSHWGRTIGLLLHTRESGGKLYSLGYASRPRCKSIRSRRSHSIIFFRARVCFAGHGGLQYGCFFCQNWDISKSKSDQVRSTHIPPEDIVALAIRNRCPSIAFTYNEPTIWAEYAIDICHAAREAGIRTVMVTNGYVTREAFHDIYDHVDAANVDLKAFTEGSMGASR